MSFVIAAPEMMTAAATDLATIGSTLDAAHRAAAAATVGIAPAAADEVSAGIAGVFSQHAQDHQALAGHAAAFNGQFVQNLATSAASYTGSEDVIVALLRGLQVSVRDLGIGYDKQVIKFISGQICGSVCYRALFVPSPLEFLSFPFSPLQSRLSQSS